MKRGIVVALCVCILVTGCSSQKNTDVPKETSMQDVTINVVEQETQKTTEKQTEENSDVDGSADYTEKIDMIFGYKEADSYKKCCSMGIPSVVELVNGSFDDGSKELEGMNPVAGYVQQEEDLPVEIANFADDMYFAGTMNIEIMYLYDSYQSEADFWSQSKSGDSSLKDIGTKTGEDDGYAWTEVYGTDKKGGCVYSVMMELDEGTALTVNLRCSKDGIIHDYKTAHTYFFDAFQRR